MCVCVCVKERGNVCFRERERGREIVCVWRKARKWEKQKNASREKTPSIINHKTNNVCITKLYLHFVIFFHFFLFFSLLFADRERLFLFGMIFTTHWWSCSLSISLSVSLNISPTYVSLYLSLYFSLLTISQYHFLPLSLSIAFVSLSL